MFEYSVVKLLNCLYNVKIEGGLMMKQLWNSDVLDA